MELRDGDEREGVTSCLKGRLVYAAGFLILVDVLLLTQDPMDDIGHSSCARPYALFLVSLWLWPSILDILASSDINVSLVLSREDTDGAVKSRSQDSSRSRASRWRAFAACATIIYSIFHFGTNFVSDERTHRFQDFVDLWHAVSLLLFAQIIICMCGIAVVSATTKRYRCKIPLLRDMSAVVYTFWRVATSPFTDVTFPDVLAGDWLTSCAKIFGDVTICVCIMTSGHLYQHHSENGVDAQPLITSDCLLSLLTPVAVSLPFVWRLLQCTRQLCVTGESRHGANALKYLTSIVVVFSSTYQRIDGHSTLHWCSVVVNTLYSFFWDVHMDWGVFEFTQTMGGASSVKQWIPRLRADRKFDDRWYYFAVAIDFILRISWSMKLSSSYNELLDGEYSSLLTQILELIRRSIWTCFRLEHEVTLVTRESSRYKKIEQREGRHGLESA